MTAIDSISPTCKPVAGVPLRNVEGGMPLLDVLPRLLDAPDRRLGVIDGDRMAGVIDSASLLEGLGRMIAPRYDCSTVVVECPASDYSASLIARAVEDADVHLMDLLSVPSTEGKVRVTLRVRCDDPSAVAHSLERFGFPVVSVSGHRYQDGNVALERLMELKTLLDV